MGDGEIAALKINFDSRRVIGSIRALILPASAAKNPQQFGQVFLPVEKENLYPGEARRDLGIGIDPIEDFPREFGNFLRLWIASSIKVDRTRAQFLADIG